MNGSDAVSEREGRERRDLCTREALKEGLKAATVAGVASSSTFYLLNSRLATFRSRFPVSAKTMFVVSTCVISSAAHKICLCMCTLINYGQSCILLS